MDATRIIRCTEIKPHRGESFLKILSCNVTAGVTVYIGGMDELQPTIGTRDLIRVGLQNLESATRCFERLHDFGIENSQINTILTALHEACDPDDALLNIADIVEFSTQREQLSDIFGDIEPTRRLIRVLGASDAMGKLMRMRPALVDAAAYDACDSHLWNRVQRIAHMRKAIRCSLTGNDDEGGNGDGNADDAPDNRVGYPPVSTLSLSEATTALRRSYHDQLAAIMAQDLMADNPMNMQPRISAELSDLADAALDAALAIARHEVKGSERCRFSIIGMGKLGAQELNYVSDVDLIYVVEPAEPPEVTEIDGIASAKTDETGAIGGLGRSDSAGSTGKLESLSGNELTRIGTKMATTLQRVCQSVVPGVLEPPLWQVDGALRPEGKDGPLVRRLDSHRGYYEQWAQNWEFQALLKARAVAGDMSLGQAYMDMTRPFVWSASKRDNFVHDCQKMRRRVEDLIPAALKEREIKLGRGGLRDVEFTVQMLQLVHGRSDESLRVSSTLDALQALKDGGYVSRPQAARLSVDYRFERVLEHRQQMWALKRTHLFPDLGSAGGAKRSMGVAGLQRNREKNVEELNQNTELRRLARAFNMLPEALLETYETTRQEVRHLHLDIYYRPMLPINAQLETEQITLSEQAAHDRFESIGFADPDAAIRHVESLTSGVSRAAKINRFLLPAVLQWLGEGQNPDMGLLNWRRLEEHFGTGSPYLGFLRDSPMAAKRLCHVLSNSRVLGDALNKSVESVRWLGDDGLLQARSRSSLDTQCMATAERYTDNINDVANSLRALRRQEIERVGLARISGVIAMDDGLEAMTDVYDAILNAACLWAVRHECASSGYENAPASITIIAMGRYGGREINFSSDADAILIYRPQHGSDDATANQFARAVVDQLRAIVQGPTTLEQKIELDLDLRPEGKNGPLIRSYASCEEYYRSWSSTWEHQALLRARYAAGDERLAFDFLKNIADPLRYPRMSDSQGALRHEAVSDEQVAEIRKLKVRMEAERLPRGVRRDRHLKLGKGGLSDVEWTVQLMQLRYAGEHEGLRVNSTLPALSELERLGLMPVQDACILRKAWRMCTAARNGNYLWSGRASRADVLPDDLDSLGGIGVYLGYDANQGQRFENDMLAVMRQCRDVTERLFYGL